MAAVAVTAARTTTRSATRAIVASSRASVSIIRAIKLLVPWRKKGTNPDANVGMRQMNTSLMTKIAFYRRLSTIASFLILKDIALRKEELG
jgi:hypothetical protein